jgi:hypothetical protein
VPKTAVGKRVAKAIEEGEITQDEAGVWHMGEATGKTAMAAYRAQAKMAKAAKAKPKGDRARLAELLEEVDEHWAALSREEIADYVQGAVAETGIPRAEVEVALSEGADLRWSGKSP